MGFTSISELPGHTADVRSIEDCLSQIMEKDRVYELRSPSAHRFGMFNNPRLMAEAAAQLSEDKSVSAVYVTLNPLRDELLDRSPNRLSPAARGQSASEEDVLHRRLMLIDLDPVREANCSSTDAEKAKARIVADQVRSYLRSCGWPDPMMCDSSNGWHLLYRVDLPAKDDGIIKDVLQSLHERFSTSDVNVDRAVHNASRITKLYGTVSRKGVHTADRPHRVSRVLLAGATA